MRDRGWDQAGAGQVPGGGWQVRGRFPAGARHCIKPGPAPSPWLGLKFINDISLVEATRARHPAA
jgi:hypothetical protein